MLGLGTAQIFTKMECRKSSGILCETDHYVNCVVAVTSVVNKGMRTKKVIESVCKP